MAPFIFTKRNGIHILDLQQTTKMIDDVHDYIVKLVSNGGKVMFVGTKKQAQDAIAEEAAKAGMPFINKRWLGGTLTNHKTIRKRAQRLKDLRRRKEEGYLDALGKKEAKVLQDEMNRLEKFIGGIADMEELPQALFIIDVKKEENAINEARKCGIPVIGILDSNCDPDLVDFKIIGNDDAIRSIRLFCQIIADSILEAKQGFLPPDSVLIQSSIAVDDDLDALSEIAVKPITIPTKQVKPEEREPSAVEERIEQSFDA
jgi:small subunit ribosomal protein S2